MVELVKLGFCLSASRVDTGGGLHPAETMLGGSGRLHDAMRRARHHPPHARRRPPMSVNSTGAATGVCIFVVCASFSFAWRGSRQGAQKRSMGEAWVMMDAEEEERSEKSESERSRRRLGETHGGRGKEVDRACAGTEHERYVHLTLTVL